MDVSQYLSVFLDEAKEHLQSLNDNIMTLEQDPENEDCINEIFRSAHSMKGMAGTMGYTRMQNLTHDMEDVFSDVRAGKIKIKSADIDVLLQCLDAIQGYVDNITENMMLRPSPGDPTDRTGRRGRVPVGCVSNGYR